MQGKVKWFSEEKGYGFITDDALIDRHFGVQDVIGAELPSIGDVIEFEAASGEKGPRAKSIQIISKVPAEAVKINSRHASTKSDDRETCQNCDKKMIPRLITYQGAVQRSVCPFCAATHKNFTSSGSWWFIFAILALMFVLYAIA